jgi:hypothetical protein
MKKIERTYPNLATGEPITRELTAEEYKALTDSASTDGEDSGAD